MSRFTKKDKNGNYLVESSDMGDYAAYYDSKHSLSSLSGEMVDTLAHYENLAEQKRLVELPCAVGDMVYEIMRVDDGFRVNPRIMKTLANIVSLMESGRWGKTIFTDKIMADKVCKKMEQGSKDVYSAANIAKYIINKCTLDGHPIGQITLQNLLYLCQRQHLQDDGEPLFYEDFYAYGIGPSIPSVYFTYSGYGAAMIASTYPESEMLLSEETMECIDTVVEKYRDCKPWEFEPLVRRSGGAWDKAMDAIHDMRSKTLRQVIPIDDIMSDYPMQKNFDDLER